jgi:hypothetical protein
MLPHTSGSNVHFAGVDGVAKRRRQSKQIGDPNKRHERREFGGGMGEFSRVAVVKRQRGKTPLRLAGFATLALIEPPTP